MIDYFCVPIGEQSINLVFPNMIDIKENRFIQAVAKYLLNKNISGIVDVIPAYHTLTVNFDLSVTNYQKTTSKIKEIINSRQLQQEENSHRILELPVCYDEEFGPDLKDVAKFGNLTVKELINLHTQTDYFIYMLGFLPGFAYMGTVPKRIAMPRLDRPRPLVPAGSVGIAGEQTGMYPVSSPGGWRLLGKTPIRLYNSRRPKPRYQAGDFIRFKSISKTEYRDIQLADQNGDYQLTEILKKEGEL